MSTASYNLSQTLLQTTTLILTGLAVAFAFRCGMFNIGGQGQYFVGLYVANWIGVSLPGMATLPHVLLGIGGAIARRRGLGRHRRLPEGDVGAHEVITTIMLNWIAIWIGTYFFGDGGPLQNSQNATVPISNDVADEREAAGLLGRSSSCRASTSASSSRSPRSSSSGPCSTGRRSATRCARSASTRRRRRTAASA